MGTNQGVTVVNPLQVESVRNIPSVTFTELKLNGVSVASDDPNSPLEYSLAYVRDIHLRHNQNSFGINFSTLDYSATIPPKFSYKLEGYDKEWSVPSALTFAAYKNLKPGTYDFHVKRMQRRRAMGPNRIRHSGLSLRLLSGVPLGPTCLFPVVGFCTLYRLSHHP